MKNDRPGNSVPVSGFPNKRTNLRKAMEAYDRLPPQLRQAVGAMLYRASTEITLDFYRWHGLEATLVWLERANRNYREAVAKEREAYSR